MFYQQTGGDFVKLTPAGNYQIADRGGLAHWCNDPLGRRSFIKRFIVKPDDWYTLSDDVTAFEQEIVTAASLTRQELPSAVPLYVTLFSPVTLAMMLAGPEVLSLHIRTAPDAVAFAITQLKLSFIKLLNLYSAAGVDGYFIASQHCSRAILTKDDYFRFAKQSDDAVLAACEKVGDTILHLHGQGIHFGAVPKVSNARVHYELDSANPTPESFRALTQCEAVIGLPLEVWQNPSNFAKHAADLLTRFSQKTALFTAPCVLPLAVDNAEVKAWIDAIRLVLD
ncbi:hypothetical protein I4W93_001925 [Rheinheimera sp. MA13]|uniref:Uroporphyrinogen decarboxylase (URO-D) domain-containing protein n=2 Tax=Rheinheimera maricola TaxID=2793282 RepID=A0ABS7X478_9GAMM|nr:uroporphyrinogen decarboxylase family protein [Rheinheimera maricola]MBZ9610345.1 hypothetical protein [Rheinheimera maricola]